MTWSETVGARGAKVTATERPGSRFLYLRWWDGAVANWRWRSLRHTDRDRATREALALALDLQTAQTVTASGSLTVAALFARFDADVVAHEAVTQRKEDRRRIAIWRAVLGDTTDITAVDRSHLDAFVRQRRAGTLQVPGHAPRKHPSGRTIGADLEFLRRVYNWGATVLDPDKQPLTTHQPLTGFEIPTTARPKRPMATYDRWLRVRQHADTAHPLFGGFLDLLDGLGWRVSALCGMAVGHVEPARRPDAPYGRVRKYGPLDKEAVDMFVPLSRALQTKVRRLLTRRAALGPMAPTAPLFPAPGNATKPWRRQYARDCLEKAEAAAGLTPIEGGDFHPYRRAWATARKTLPLADVASAGGWKSTRALELAYIQADPATMLAVVSSTARVRDPRNRSTHRSSPTKKRRGKRA